MVLEARNLNLVKWITDEMQNGEPQKEKKEIPEAPETVEDIVENTSEAEEAVVEE